MWDGGGRVVAWFLFVGFGSLVLVSVSQNFGDKEF